MSENNESGRLKTEEIRKIVQRAISTLMEHFDTVQVFVSRYDPLTKETYYTDDGEGNFLARIAQIRGWSDRQTEQFFNPEVLDEDDDDEGDEDDEK